MSWDATSKMIPCLGYRETHWASYFSLIVNVAQALVLCLLWSIFSVSLLAGTSTHQKALHPGSYLHRSLRPEKSLSLAVSVLLRWAKNSFGFWWLFFFLFYLLFFFQSGVFLAWEGIGPLAEHCSVVGLMRWDSDGCVGFTWLCFGLWLKYYSLKFSVIIWHENVFTL